MRDLAQADKEHISKFFIAKNESENFQLEYGVDSLIEYGLCKRQTVTGASRVWQAYGLTDVGMRFKNSLLAYADFEIRLKDLWNVETEGLTLEQLLHYKNV